MSFAEHRLRVAIAATATVAAAVGCLGLSARMLFTEPSPLKYLLTVAVPTAAVAVAASADPLRVLLGAVILVAPFAFVSTFAGVAITPLLPLLLVAGLLVVFERRRVGRANGLQTVLPFVLALLAFAIAEASSPGHYLILIATAVLTGTVAARVVARPGGAAIVATFLVASATVQAVLAIWEFRSGHQLDLYRASATSSFGSDYFFNFGTAYRPAAALPDPISLGHVLAISLPLAGALAVSCQTLARRLAFICAGGLIALALALTFSRMSWIGASLGILVTLWALPARRRTMALAGTAAVVAIVAAVALAYGGASLRTRFASVANPTARTVATAEGDRERLALWQAALTVAGGHPVFGVGFGEIRPALAAHASGVKPGTTAHSTYLQVLAETGVVGALALVLLLVGTARDLVRGFLRQRLLAAGLVGSFAALLACWTTDYTVRYPQVAALVAVLFGIAAGLARSTDQGVAA